MIAPKVGVLLLNLGTPKSPKVSDVRAYLSEFLSDRRVVDLPFVLRKILLQFFILPFRPKQSAKAYAAIWDKARGSPLLFHSIDLITALKKELPSHFEVALAMRYGEPTIASALHHLVQTQCHKILVLPLFPQYSSAATGSALAKVLALIKENEKIPEIITISDFYADPNYLWAQTKSIASYLTKEIDSVIFSFHSLPQRQIEKTGSLCSVDCQKGTPCHPISWQTKWCYRAQCYETARVLAKHLDLDEGKYHVAFQSRLGRTVWIGPDIETVFNKLIQEKVKNIVIACPSFVADCLETLEEIGMRAAEKWQSLGGGKLTLVPCMNADPSWVKALSKVIQNRVFDSNIVFGAGIVEDGIDAVPYNATN